MIGQYYEIAGKHSDLAKPGQLVFDSNGDDEVIGFIYSVNESSSEIVLFEPRELPEETLRCMDMPAHYSNMLMDALKNSPELVKMWKELVNESDPEEF